MSTCCFPADLKKFRCGSSAHHLSKLRSFVPPRLVLTLFQPHSFPSTTSSSALTRFSYCLRRCNSYPLVMHANAVHVPAIFPNTCVCFTFAFCISFLCGCLSLASTCFLSFFLATVWSSAVLSADVSSRRCLGVGQRLGAASVFWRRARIYFVPAGHNPRGSRFARSGSIGTQMCSGEGEWGE